MIDLVDGIIPSKDDKSNPELLEEATRLFYVGMTRAKSHLELMVYQNRDGEKAEESSFVANVRDIVDPPKENSNKDIKIAAKSSAVKKEIPYNPNAIRS